MAITGWQPLDALIALAVAVNIVIAGSGLVRRSVGGLMDQALGQSERDQITDALSRFERDGVHFHALRTRQAGSRAFISVHVLVPGGWLDQAWRGRSVPGNGRRGPARRRRR